MARRVYARAARFRRCWGSCAPRRVSSARRYRVLRRAAPRCSIRRCSARAPGAANEARAASAAAGAASRSAVSGRATVSARGCRVCVVTGVLLFINTIKGNVEDILCACVHRCAFPHTRFRARRRPQRPESGDWCLSSPLVSWETWHARHTTRPARRAARKP